MNGVTPALREMALVAHSLPHAELRVTLRDGRRLLVSGHPSAVMPPCALRRGVGQYLDGCPGAAWVGAIEHGRLVAGRCVDLGAGLYVAWCAGAPLYAFTSELDLGVLHASVAALPDGEVSVRLMPDPLLALTLVSVGGTGATVHRGARPGAGTRDPGERARRGTRGRARRPVGIRP